MLYKKHVLNRRQKQILNIITRTVNKRTNPKIRFVLPL